MTEEQADLLDTVDKYFEQLICSDGSTCVDKEPTVVLTLNEAKKWMQILHENAPYLDCLYESSRDDYDFLEEISNRIKQVEQLDIH